MCDRYLDKAIAPLKSDKPQKHDYARTLGLAKTNLLLELNFGLLNVKSEVSICHCHFKSRAVKCDRLRPIVMLDRTSVQGMLGSKIRNRIKILVAYKKLTVLSSQDATLRHQLYLTISANAGLSSGYL